MLTEEAITDLFESVKKNIKRDAELDKYPPYHIGYYNALRQVLEIELPGNNFWERCRGEEYEKQNTESGKTSVRSEEEEASETK